jgi:hypothetical protein
MANGTRTSSISWEQRSARELREPTTFTPPGVRPSPSTPTELTNVRSRPIVAPRPHTQLLPEAAEHINPTPHSARSRYEKGISSPGALGSPQPDRWDDDDALWSPVSAGDGSLRPFSFAVRAGAAAGDGHGHGRKSLFGRWGGSVTSFFGGSQGGSGSMMDMQYALFLFAVETMLTISLGLDSDRRAAYPNSAQPHRDVYPRAVSMASPSRPSFFSKDSRTSVDQPRDPRALTKSISSSRLSQVVRNDQGAGAEEPKKKKGLKGLIQKMKPKSKRSSSGLVPPLPHSHSHSQQYTSQENRRGLGQGPNDGTTLAPPPNMAYLSGDGQNRHHRNTSQSSMADSQSQGSNWKLRSVSAPIGGSSSGSQSASPTSSRYRRESYNSQAQARQGDREQDQGQHVEMLHAPATGAQYQQRQMFTSPEPGLGQYLDDRRVSNTTQPTANLHGNPNPSFRTSKYASGSISTSSGVAPTIETPPMPFNANATPYFSRPPSINSPATAFSPNMPSTSGNANRFKNLPPLPPTDDSNARRMASSPDSFQMLNDQSYSTDPTTPNNRTRTPLYQQPTQMYDSGPPHHTRQGQGQGMPRASFDRPTTTPRAEPSPRMVHSMYAQPTMGHSNLSLESSRFPPTQGQGVPHGNGNGFMESGNEKKGLKKGFKGFFGGAKAGRMA